MLIVGAVLMTGAGLVFASSANPWVLLLAGTIGVISPSGQEVGPFLPIEQAALSHVVTDRTRTEVFAWYTLTGSVATALGALAAGIATRFLQETAVTPVDSYRAVVIVLRRAGRGPGGVVRAAVAPDRGGDRPASQACARRPLAGTVRTRPVADVGDEAVGAVCAGRLRGRIRRPELRGVLVLPAVRGRRRERSARSSSGPTSSRGCRRCWRPAWRRVSAWSDTMVFTHLPSNVLLILVPLMPTLPLAVTVLLAALQHQPDGRAGKAVLRHGRGDA